MLVQQFQKYITNKNLFSSKSKLLIAVSGGKDSMALTELIEKCGYKYAVAHCNFCLRNGESERDEKFILKYFNNKGISVFTKRFNTLAYSEEKKLSIQMAARELRYLWFNELMDHHSFDFLLTAHHLNDSIETLFINLIRGTGINGLKGIPEKQHKIIRPLLNFKSEDLEKFITDNNIPFVEDSSNIEAKYLRNKLRHKVIPVLKEINPDLENTIKKEISIFHQSSNYIENKLEEDFSKLFNIKNRAYFIGIARIKNFKFPELIIYFMLKKFDFSLELTEQIKTMIENPETGKKIIGETYSCLIDRDNLIFKKHTFDSNLDSIQIYRHTTVIDNPILLNFINHNYAFINKARNNACLDAEKLNYPLELRKWKTGDYYYPIGMNGKKKISDFFTNNKYSYFDKEEQWFLTSNNEIVWILGERVDRRYMVTEQTKQTLQVIIGE